MKKRIICLLFLICFLCGCEDINHKDDLAIVDNINSVKIKVNTYRTGYKYYLPKSLKVKDYILYNEVIESNKYDYYLYVDTISYFNKIDIPYEENKDAYLSKIITKDDKKGYVEINLQENNQYLIEIMFNYAKIEVIVDYEDIKISLDYAIDILSSIKYNDKIIANLLGEDVLNYQEEVYNIFDTTSEDSNYLTMVSEDTYVEEEENIKDSDLIN